jgi:tetratricopeptide (TPR) repeat protein
MKLAARLLLSIAIAAAGGLAIYRFCWLRHVCNNDEERIEQLTTRFYDHSESMSVRVLARRNADRMRECSLLFPTNVNVYMLRAANLRMMGLRAEAADEYRNALRYDHRRELYLELGLTELENGEPEKAADTLTTACIYQSDLYSQVPEPTQSIVYERSLPFIKAIEAGKVTDVQDRELRARLFREPL